METELLHEQNITNEPYTFLGNVTGYTPIERGIEVAVGDARLRILVLSPRIIRVRAAHDGDFLPRRPWAPDRSPAEWPNAPISIAETPDYITLDTGVVVAEIQRNPARIRFVDRAGQPFAADDPASGYGWRAQSESKFLGRLGGDDVLGTLVCRKTLPDSEYYYGFGERTGLLEKRGARYTHWTTDSWDHSPNVDVMYQAIPFFLALRPADALAYGIYFNNTFRTVYDMGYLDPHLYQLEAQGGELDYYLIYGPTPAEVLSGYAEITGHMPMPPRWALGFHQSRWSYSPESAVRAVAEGYRSRGIPAEVIHLDIDYMRGYRDFTWDPERFPDPARLIADLRSQGFRVVTIIDPSIKYEPDTPFFDDAVKQGHFLRDASGELAHGEVWPGDCVFPDFVRSATRAWWGDQHQSLLDAGVAGIWNDMNEPAAGKTELPTGAPSGDDTRPATFAETHNLYGYLQARATHEGQRRLRPDERPFLLTRSGFAGIQRYSAVWTGDNASCWEHLELSLPALSNLSLSGIAFCGTDIGGFWRNATPELFARWVEIGALAPFSRAHTANGTAPHEPWAFGPDVEAIARRYIKLRYRLLPHLYTLFHDAATTGAPIWRPLVYAYPTDPRVTTLHDQVLLGSDLLLAPVYRPGVTERRVYLPAGIWRDYWTGELFSGGQALLAPAPLDVLPIYVREGSIIPTGPTLHYSDERPLDHLTLDIYAGDETPEASGMLYEDDGSTMAYQQGASRTTRYHYRRDSQNGQTATLSATTDGGYTPTARGLTLRFHGPAIHAAHLDGNTGSPLAVTPAAAGAETVHSVEIPTDPGAWTLTIEHAHPNG